MAKGRLAFKASIEKFHAHKIPIEIGSPELCQQRSVKEMIRFKDPAGFQHELFYGLKWDPNSFIPSRPHGGYVANDRGSISFRSTSFKCR
jgi:hypothetical protein